MQSIDEWVMKIKHWSDVSIGDWGLLAIVFLVGFGSFGLGRLSSLESARPPVSVSQAPSEAQPRGISIGGLVVASRTGSAYYYPWCAGASKINQLNQVWFASETTARAAGYVPAKNCKGLGVAGGQ